MKTRAASSLFSSGLAACFCLCACKSTPPAPSGSSAKPAGTASGAASAGASSAASAEAGGGKLKEPGPTTSPDIAILNFKAQFPEYERHLKDTPDSLFWTGSMLTARQAEVSSLGVVSSLDKVVELGDKAVKEHPKIAKAHMLRASARSAIHDFAGAAKEIDEADKLRAKPEDPDVKPWDVDGARASLAMALGKYDEAHERYSKMIAERPHAYSLALLDGACLGFMQKTDEAMKRFEESEQQYRDVSPFFVSWLYFERGNTWDKAGDPVQAKLYYRIAVERLPQYAHAVLHLSELLPANQAKPLLEKLIEGGADDPEAHASLSLVQEELAPGSGKEHFDKAKAAFDELMTKFPLAFADHAGWFYLNVAKDPERALDAAKLNLDNRKTAESYDLMIAAQLGVKKDAEACKTADEALKFKYPSIELRLHAAEAYERCNKKDLAEKQRGLVGNVKTGGRGR
jgi:predicted Zn-dependent protease